MVGQQLPRRQLIRNEAGKDRVKITGSTACIPLIGHPIKQVRTPPAINDYLSACGLDAVMIAADIRPDAIEAFMLAARGWENCIGISVTVPHKQAALRLIDDATERAKRVGAVNIIRRSDDGRLLGDMVDGLAFVAAMKDQRAQVQGADCLLVGAGGAGSAIAHALADAGVRSLAVVDIDQVRQDTLAAQLAGLYRRVAIRGGPPDSGEFDLIVNASTLGMRGSDPQPFDVRRLRTDGLAADVVTRPNITPFLEEARRIGRRTLTGEDMALAQLPFQATHLGFPPVSGVHLSEGSR